MLVCYILNERQANGGQQRVRCNIKLVSEGVDVALCCDECDTMQSKLALVSYYEPALTTAFMHAHV